MLDIYIDMKIIITENKLERVAINWLDKKYGDLEPFETKDYFGSVFYKKDNDVIFEYSKKGYVYVSYDEIWSILESFFGMDNQQIQNLIKVWVEEHYNLNVKKITNVTNQTYERWNHNAN